jgi:hypothetical protein
VPDANPDGAITTPIALDRGASQATTEASGARFGCPITNAVSDPAGNACARVDTVTGTVSCMESCSGGIAAGAMGACSAPAVGTGTVSAAGVVAIVTEGDATPLLIAGDGAAATPSRIGCNPGVVASGGSGSSAGSATGTTVCVTGASSVSITSVISVAGSVTGATA